MNAFVEGVRDILPAELRKRRNLYKIIRNVFAQNAYREVITPTLESLELYSGIEGLLDKSEMFKVVDETGQILVLRPDLTMPIARLAATRFKDTPRPIKFSYLSSAYQSKNSQSLSLKEKTQAGVELIGCAEMESDLEMILLLYNTMKAVMIENPIIDIGHADLINEIFAGISLKSEEKTKMRSLLAEKNKVAINKYLKKLNLPEEQEDMLLALPELFGQPEDVLAELRSFSLSTKALEVMDKLDDLFSQLKKVNLIDHLTFDPMLISRHGYYTGLIFKGYAQGYNNLLAGGGRYDNLTEKFGSGEAAVGFALEIENILEYLNRSDNFIENDEKRILITYQANIDFKKTYELAQKFREKNYCVEIFNGEKSQEYLDFQQIDYKISIFKKEILVKDLKEKDSYKIDRESYEEDILNLILSKFEEVI